MSERESTSDPIVDLARQLLSLNSQAVSIYSPIVEQIVTQQSTDRSLIESTLDGLLGFAGTEDGLALFKKLCRYYWDLGPLATASYISAFREMWDEESLDA
ncbi:hypothetical protein Pla22_37150 [Rubripirellula amarantea]|uniref:Uncharacterized protein n=1 Tax=Rubripirellula amarantea TaxID=2527999 RepID=A0A5C5WMF1_9BACT|nr:hypothetical protein [Rubripirellula amarantea]TWT50972.1 hypothetical protein Pla22_37150 [Rubripirellula amarantea]